MMGLPPEKSQSQASHTVAFCRFMDYDLKMLSKIHTIIYAVVCKNCNAHDKNEFIAPYTMLLLDNF